MCIVDLAHEKDDLRKAISVSIKTLYIVLAIFAERCIQSETTEKYMFYMVISCQDIKDFQWIFLSLRCGPECYFGNEVR